MPWFKNEKELDRAIEEYEDKHGILCWTDGSETIRGLFAGLTSEADGEGRIAKGFVYATRFRDGDPAFVLAKHDDLDAREEGRVIRDYLELVSSPVGKPKPRRRGAKKARPKPRRDAQEPVEAPGPVEYGTEAEDSGT